jgi:hypothetical protein
MVERTPRPKPPHDNIHLVSTTSTAPTLRHVLAVYAFAVVGASIYTALGLFTFVLVWERVLSEAIAVALGGLVFGVIPGIISLLWVMYCLLESDLRRSVPYVFAITAITSVLTGPLGPGMILTITIANLIACRMSYRRHNAAKWRRRHGLCIKCEYDLRGLNGVQCPECGTYQRAITVTLDRTGAPLREEVHPLDE